MPRRPSSPPTIRGTKTPSRSSTRWSPEARYLRIADRGEAIRAAAMLARPGDIVLLAGKGHETYQIVGDERRHFDDRQQIEHQFSIHR